MKIDDKSKASPLSNKKSRPQGTPLPPANYRVMIEIAQDSSAEFVEQVALRVFGLEKNKLTKLRTELLQDKRAECGVFVHEIAETKAAEVMGLANDNEHSLECFIEKDVQDDAGTETQAH